MNAHHSAQPRWNGNYGTHANTSGKKKGPETPTLPEKTNMMQELEQLYVYVSENDGSPQLSILIGGIPL